MSQAQRFAEVLKALSIIHLQPVSEVVTRMKMGDDALITEALRLDRELTVEGREG